MAKTKTINGVTYTIPETGEDGWGANVTAYLEAIADGGIFTGSGSVTLSQDLNLGNTAGLIVKYVKSNSSNIADSGIIRLANGDDIAWRNNANGANLVLEVNASDKLTFNSKEVLVTDNSATVTNKSIDSDNNTITNIVNADIKAAAAIDATKIADGSVTSTEFQYISTLSSNAQTQITANASNIATNTSNISTNTANITSNDTDIAARLKKDGSEAMTGDLDLGSNNLVTTGNVDGRDVSSDGTKLDGIEALADVTDATNVAAAGALMKSGGTMTGNIDMGSHNIVTTGNVDGRDLNTDGTKLDGIEAAADVTDATNVAAAGALMKSGGTMTGNIDMGSHNIVTTGNVDGRDLNTDGTKLDGIEASADVTDATNVAAAGALMKSGGTMTGNLDMGSHNIVTTGNVDGRDLNTDGTKLDGIEALADVTDATNVAAAGAVMDSDVQTSTSLGSDNANPPSQLAVKTYVDSAVSGAGTGVKITSANYTILDDDNYAYIDVTTSTNTIVITLPAVSSNTGRNITVRKADSGSGKVTVKSEGASVTINGVSGSTGVDLTSQYDVLEVFEANSLWGGFGPATSTYAGFLSHYEEGTWSPAYASAGSNVTGTATFNDAKYTRIGRRVFATINSITGLSCSSNNSHCWWAFTSTDLPGVTNSTQFAGTAMLWFGTNTQKTSSIDQVGGSDTHIAFGFESSSGVGSLSGATITLYRVTFSYDI